MCGFRVRRPAIPSALNHLSYEFQTRMNDMQACMHMCIRMRICICTCVRMYVFMYACSLTINKQHAFDRSPHSAYTGAPNGRPSSLLGRSGGLSLSKYTYIIYLPTYVWLARNEGVDPDSSP